MKTFRQLLQAVSGVSAEESLFLWEFHSATYVRQLVVVAMIAISAIWNVVTQIAQDSFIPPLIAFACIKLVMVVALILRAVAFGRHLHLRGGLRFKVKQTYRQQLGILARQRSVEEDITPFESDFVLKYCGVLSDWFWLFWLTVGVTLDTARVWVQCGWSEDVRSRVGACIGYDAPTVVPAGPILFVVFYALLAPLVVASIKGNVWIVLVAFVLIVSQWATLAFNQSTYAEDINAGRLWMLLIMVFVSLFVVAISVPWSAQVAFQSRRLAEKRYFDLKRAIAEGREAKNVAKADEAKARAETAAQVAERTLAFTFHTLRNPLHSLLASLTELTEDSGPVGEEARRREEAALAATFGTPLPYQMILGSLQKELQSMKQTVESMNHRVEHAGRHSALLSGAVVAKAQETNVREWLKETVTMEAHQHCGVPMALSVHSAVPQTARIDPILTAELVHHAIENAVAAVRTAWGQSPESEEQDGMVPFPPEMAESLRAQGLPEAHISVVAAMQTVMLPQRPPTASTSGAQERDNGRGDGAETGSVPTACLVLEVVNVGSGLPLYVSIERLLSPFRKPVHDHDQLYAPAPATVVQPARQQQREAVHDEAAQEFDTSNQGTRLAVRSMGLGLSLCRLICVLLDGQLTLYDDSSAAMPTLAVESRDSTAAKVRQILNLLSPQASGLQRRQNVGEREPTEMINVQFKLTRFTVTLPLGNGAAHQSAVPDHNSSTVSDSGHIAAFQIKIPTPRAAQHAQFGGEHSQFIGTTISQRTPTAQRISTHGTQGHTSDVSEAFDIDTVPADAVRRVSSVSPSFSRSLAVDGTSSTPFAVVPGGTSISAIPPRLRDIGRQPLRSTTASERSVAASSTMSPYTREQPLAGVRLLVVDDELSVRRATARMLSRAGALVSLASDGDEVLSMLRAASEVERPFDAVLLDIIMRRMNGEEACILARGAGYIHLPILAASGNTVPADIAEYMSNGFTGVLSKPFTLHDAVKALQKTGVTAMPGRLL